jgi:hypothetical protein
MSQVSAWLGLTKERVSSQSFPPQEMALKESPSTSQQSAGQFDPVSPPAGLASQDPLLLQQFAFVAQSVGQDKHSPPDQSQAPLPQAFPQDPLLQIWPVAAQSVSQIQVLYRSVA